MTEANYQKWKPKYEAAKALIAQGFTQEDAVKQAGIRRQTFYIVKKEFDSDPLNIRKPKVKKSEMVTIPVANHSKWSPKEVAEFLKELGVM